MEQNEKQQQKKEALVEKCWDNEQSSCAEEDGDGMNGAHGLVQPPALRNGAGAKVPKLHLLKRSAAPKVNQSPEAHAQMSKTPLKK